nr:MAG TPA: hypothetical protein [Caudoviricetes sp.]
MIFALLFKHTNEQGCCNIDLCYQPLDTDFRQSFALP